MDINLSTIWNETLLSSFDLEGIISPSEMNSNFNQEDMDTTSHQFLINSTSSTCVDESHDNGKMVGQVKEMMYRAAALRPVRFAEEAAEKPKRRNVRISSDRQTAAARRRRERISERLRVLRRLIPGGSKMDTASMLDEAANYLKFLKAQVSLSEKAWCDKILMI